jgi:hypothetical protein
MNLVEKLQGSSTLYYIKSGTIFCPPMKYRIICFIFLGVLQHLRLSMEFHILANFYSTGQGSNVGLLIPLLSILTLIISRIRENSSLCGLCTQWNPGNQFSFIT